MITATRIWMPWVPVHSHCSVLAKKACERKSALRAWHTMSDLQNIVPEQRAPVHMHGYDVITAPANHTARVCGPRRKTG